MAVAAALALALGIAEPTAAQTCGSPIPASLGNTAFTTTAGNTIVLTGLCDLSQISTDVMYNASWFRFVAPSSGTYVAGTCGSVNFDSKMAVFTDCSNLASVIGCNDDTPGCKTTNGQSWASKVTFNATAGTAYYIAVGGFGASTVGAGSLSVSSSGTGGPDGSSCTNAITAVAGLNSFNTAGSAEDVNLAGLCDPGTAGDEILHRAREPGELLLLLGALRAVLLHQRRRRLLDERRIVEAAMIEADALLQLVDLLLEPRALRRRVDQPGQIDPRLAHVRAAAAQHQGRGEGGARPLREGGSGEVLQG
jgi:hypothetical protein